MPAGPDGPSPLDHVLPLSRDGGPSLLHGEVAVRSAHLHEQGVGGLLRGRADGAEYLDGGPRVGQDDAVLGDEAPRTGAGEQLGHVDTVVGDRGQVLQMCVRADADEYGPGAGRVGQGHRAVSPRQGREVPGCRAE